MVVGPDGDLIGQYQKVHLRGEERLAFRPGYRYPVFGMGFGQLGLMIGWDLCRQPQSYRAVVRRY